jgi:hypothetical protein
MSAMPLWGCGRRQPGLRHWTVGRTAGQDVAHVACNPGLPRQTGSSHLLVRKTGTSRAPVSATTLAEAVARIWMY